MGDTAPYASRFCIRGGWAREYPPLPLIKLPYPCLYWYIALLSRLRREWRSLVMCMSGVSSYCTWLCSLIPCQCYAITCLKSQNDFIYPNLAYPLAKEIRIVFTWFLSQLAVSMSPSLVPSPQSHARTGKGLVTLLVVHYCMPVLPNNVIWYIAPIRTHT